MINVKHAVLRGLYATGALSAYHRAKNRDTLTVLGFHRVLPPTDPRSDGALSEYTIPVDVFEPIIRFFGRHYTFVDIDQVVAARLGSGALPPYAALVTFDDGWTDNEDLAAPILNRYGVPAIAFVVADGSNASGFWGEEVHAGLRILGPSEFPNLWREFVEGPPPESDDFIASIERFWSTMVGAPLEERERLLRSLRSQVGNYLESNILDDSGLRSLAASVRIGGHGLVHDPLTEVPDLRHELQESRRVLERRLGESRDALADVMSFPHGRYDSEVVREAREAGFRLMFTSDHCLNPTYDGQLHTDVLGRVFASPNTSRGGRFSGMFCANHFFRPRISELDGTGPRFLGA